LEISDLVFDSVQVYFFVDVFLKQFLIHIFPPVVAVFGNPRAQAFSRMASTPKKRQPMDAEMIGIFPMIMYMSVISYYLMPEDNRSMIQGAIWMPLLMFIRHRLVVALKYASFSDTEYEKIQNPPTTSQADRNMYQTQINFAWSERDTTLLKYELACAAIRINAKINEIVFYIQPDVCPLTKSKLLQWNALLRGDETLDENKPLCNSLIRQPDGSYLVSLFSVGMALLQQPEKSHHIHHISDVLICISRITMIPIVKCAFDKKFTERSDWLYVFQCHVHIHLNEASLHSVTGCESTITHNA